MTRYDEYPDHPLGVPQEVLDAARKPVREAADYNDVDPDYADSIADAVVSVLHSHGFIQWRQGLMRDDAPHPWTFHDPGQTDATPRITDDNGAEVSMGRAWREVQLLRSSEVPDRRAPDQTLTDHAEHGGMPLLLVSNLGADRPVFHLPSWESMEGDEDALLTRCGNVDRLVFLGSLHVKHARWIGVACFDCFAA